MRKGEARLLSELLKDSKRSDRELGRLLKLSQPTITRTRHKLEKEGWVQQYTVVPNFVKLGFEILAISCFKSKLNKESIENSGRLTVSKPNVVFAAECNGMKMNVVVISLHKEYSDYVEFVREVRSEFGADLNRADSLIVSLEGLVFKPLGFKCLAETLEE